MKFINRCAIMILLALAGLLLAACSSSQPASTTQSPDGGEILPPVRSESSVMAEGKVVPSQDAAISFSTAGVVGELLVKEGEQVSLGQPLVRLVGNEQIQSAIAAGELELLSAQHDLNNLKEEADVARSQAQLAVADAKKALDKAQKRLDSRDYRRGDEEQVDIARANYVISQDGVDKATEFYDQVDDRAEDDPVRAEALSQLAVARQKRATALANLNYLLAKPNDLDVAQIDAQLAVTQSNLADAERRLARLQNGPDAEQLSLAEARVKNASVSLEAAKAKLNDLELDAPFAGTISALNTTVGEYVSPGVAVVTLADFSTWMVETTDITELNIARVNLGQPAMIHFDAIPDIGLIGRVTTIKPFGENRQGDIVYTVVLKLETTDERLRWNMTTSVDFLEKDK
ncbi:MAG: efflux RND transporter periplasmic adaptor subunit [Anaerolineaceae bacterium]|nr:efflux RND transporter periplasmic adaptor subunit [Anaerolineaceae bacterium]